MMRKEIEVIKEQHFSDFEVRLIKKGKQLYLEIKWKGIKRSIPLEVDDVYLLPSLDLPEHEKVLLLTMLTNIILECIDKLEKS